MRVLLLSAYGARSHVYWRESLCAMFPQWRWQVLELPPRHFSWRIRGNPLFWSIAERAVLEAQYDVVLATSMVDLATLRGLVPSLAACRTLLYFHENQFAYPEGRNQTSIVEPQMVSLYSALAADGLLFNSQFNRDSFLDGCATLLAKLPDYVPPGVAEGLLAKSSVVPVPITGMDSGKTTMRWPGSSRQKASSTLRLTWLGRFEYDKGPDRLLGVLQALERMGVDYELAIVGQQFRSLPAAFESLANDYAHRLVHLGFIAENDQFLAFLGETDIALSTALHEFQGLALIEAAAAGAIPVVPARQAYPEVFTADFQYSSNLEDAQAEANSAAAKIVSISERLRAGNIKAPDVSRYFSQSLRRQYSALLTPR